MLSFFLRGTSRSVLLRAVMMTAAIATADWRIEGNIPLGFLYLFPMLLLGSILSRWQIALSALICTVLTEAFDSFDWFAAAAIPRDILIFAAFFCMGLFVYEVVRSRQTAAIHTESIEREARARSDAEEQLKVLIESSPAAVFTADAKGSILLANEAAHRLFGITREALPGRSVRDFLPSFSNVLNNISAHENGRSPFPHGHAVQRPPRRRCLSGGRVVLHLPDQRRSASGRHGGGRFRRSAQPRGDEPAPVAGRIAHPGGRRIA